MTVLAVDRFPKYLTGTLQRQQEAGSFSALQKKLLLHRAETLDAAWVGVGGECLCLGACGLLQN